MAEELAKTRLGMKHLKLTNCHKAVKLTIALGEGGTVTPSENLLTRQVKHLKTAWDEFEENMLKLQECAASENLAAYVKDFETEHKEFTATNQRAEELLE